MYFLKWLVLILSLDIGYGLFGILGIIIGIIIWAIFMAIFDDEDIYSKYE